jgi:hypothetical protein
MNLRAITNNVMVGGVIVGGVGGVIGVLSCSLKASL